MIEPQNLYFRTKDNGAAVFRIDTENRQKRLELQPIANVNLNKGDFNPNPETPPTKEEAQQIYSWINKRRAVVTARHLDDVTRLIDTLNSTAQWLQAKATAEELDIFADDLLLSMHDLRSVIVRKKAAQLMRD